MRGSFDEVVLGGGLIITGFMLGGFLRWFFISVGIVVLWDAWEESRKL